MDAGLPFFRYLPAANWDESFQIVYLVKFSYNLLEQVVVFRLFVFKLFNLFKKAHSLTPFNMAFNTDRRSELRNPFSSNSSNNENVGMFSSPRRAASFPLHITSNCLPTFMLSSLWLISNSKLLYSYSDISKQRLHLFHQVFPLSSHPYHSYRSARYS